MSETMYANEQITKRSKKLETMFGVKQMAKTVQLPTTMARPSSLPSRWQHSWRLIRDCCRWHSTLRISKM